MRRSKASPLREDSVPAAPERGRSMRLAHSNEVVRVRFSNSDSIAPMTAGASKTALLSRAVLNWRDPLGRNGIRDHQGGCIAVCFHFPF